MHYIGKCVGVAQEVKYTTLVITLILNLWLFSQLQYKIYMLSVLYVM